MYALEERTQIIELVQTLPDEQIHYVLNIIKSLPPEKPIIHGRQLMSASMY